MKKSLVTLLCIVSLCFIFLVGCSDKTATNESFSDSNTGSTEKSDVETEQDGISPYVDDTVYNSDPAIGIWEYTDSEIAIKMMLDSGNGFIILEQYAGNEKRYIISGTWCIDERGYYILTGNCNNKLNTLC